MLIAVRTVAETDDIRTIEGLGFPFKSRDTYGTHYSARTNFHWDLFPDIIPGATRADDSAPLFIRPTTYHHGFEPDFGLARIGGWSPVRTDEDGVWVQAQIDKRQKYYATRIKPLLDSGALGLSGGSAEHSVRIDAGSGEILEWPAYELALTPLESNPLAQIATRAGETLRIVAAVRRDSEQASEPTAARGIQTFSDIVAAAEMNEELPEAFDTLSSAIYSAIYATDADWNPVPADEKRSAIQTSLDQFRDYILALIDAAQAETPARAFLSAIRTGRRNGAGENLSLTTAHDHIASLLGLTCLPGDAPVRSAEDLPAFRFIAEPERPDDVLGEMATRAATQAAEDAVRKLTG